MTQFFNAKEDIVQQAMDGLISASGGRLTRLDGYPFIRVVVRGDWDKSKVAVISGGGSGHEPAHAGFVGEGMLSAAVCGDVFASPSVDAVLAAIVAVTGSAGCILIVKNYTGDRLNFGLAAERARALGLKVNMVIVDDDVALPGHAKARGVAGTLFVHKLAGEVSEVGGTLADVTQAALRAQANVISVGMSLDTCRVPGSPKENRIPPGELEVGLGIHGEPGARRIPFGGARQAMNEAVALLKPKMNQRKYAALLNNLGGTSALEMLVLTEALLASPIGDQISHIVGPASMMTALDMHGFSVSLYPLTIEDEMLLAEPTPLKAWPGLKPIVEPAVLPMPPVITRQKHDPSDDPTVAGILNKCCASLVEAEADLNALDAKVGDGDTGTTLATAARALLARIDQLPLANRANLLTAISSQLTQTMGGSSGVLLAIFFAAAGDAAKKGHDIVSALRAGLDRMQEIGGAKPGDRTMIDALHPALARLNDGLGAAALAARGGASATAHMVKAEAGRASYVGAGQLGGVTDPGAEAVARLFESLASEMVEL
ncbi:MAG: dihydroxyacetone kinase subunit DhaK [Rhizobium sp.]|nr:dihydroxyacetone kinase subunit DhaK [Rhizobium sp.]